MGTLATTLNPRHNGCAFGALISEHGDQDDINTIENGDVTTSDILRFVNEHWGPVGKTTVAVHRRHECACYMKSGN